MEKLLPIVLIVVSCLMPAFAQETMGQGKTIRVLQQDAGQMTYASTSLPYLDSNNAVIRYEKVKIADALKDLSALHPQDNLILDLFDNVTYTGIVTRVEEYFPGNVTVTAKLAGFDFGYILISTYEGRTLSTIGIPDLKKQYRITSSAETLEHFLVEMDLSKVKGIREDGPAPQPDAPTPEEMAEKERIQRTLQMNQMGPGDPARIDVMFVYTAAALSWEVERGGLFNLIAMTMANNQLVLDNSNVSVNLKLVHAGLVDYDENGVDNEETLERLQDRNDGFMDDVHDWRNYYGADIVQLIIYDDDNYGGISYCLDDESGSSESAYSVVAALGLENLSQYLSIHEMGHTFGCGHNGDQWYQPGPQLYYYSAGWRWQDADDDDWCTVMTYNEGEWFFPPEPGVFYNCVPYFSNPDINLDGFSAGDEIYADNARTIRETKHLIAAYREIASLSCLECPAYNFELDVTGSWKTTSATINTGECKIYRFFAEDGKSYEFKTGCGDGATADFDTKLILLNTNCIQVRENDDGCESGRSKIQLVADTTGYYYLKVRGSDGATGDYTLAYKQLPGCNADDQYPSNTLTPEPYWQYISYDYIPQFSCFHVTEGEEYTWSYCSAISASAPFDSRLTLRKKSDNNILAFADDQCGDDARITWTADFTGTVKLVIANNYNCNSGGRTWEASTLGYKSGSPGSPYLTISNNEEVGPENGTVSLWVSSNVEWEVSDDAAWVKSTIPRRGGGDKTIEVTYNANPGTSQRTATITATSSFGSSSVTLKQLPDDGYCNSTKGWGGTLSPTNDWQYKDNMWAGIYATCPVVSGVQYHWTLCLLYGGSVDYDAELTLRRADNNQFLAYSGGGCGTGDYPLISWTATFTGDVKIIVTKTSCQWDATQTKLAYKSGTLISRPFFLSHKIKELVSSAGSTTFEITTSDSWTIFVPPGDVSDWILSIQPMQGSGNAVVTVTYAQNQTSLQREAAIQVTSLNTTEDLTLRQYPGDGNCNSVSRAQGPATPTDNWQYLENFQAGTFIPFEVDSGNVYHWSLCPAHGGQAMFDSELTLRKSIDNSFIVTNNNMCGDDARITWTADFTGMVKLILTQFPCNPTMIAARLAYKKGILQNPYPIGPQPLMVPAGQIVPPKSGTTTFNITSNTTWELVPDQGFISLSRTTGTGNAIITVEYGDNTGSSRTANISASALYVPGTFANNTVTQFDFCDSQNHTSASYQGDYIGFYWRYISCFKAGEYAEFTVVAGQKYQWSMCPQHGGAAPFATELTLRKGSDNSFIAFSNNYNESGTNAYLVWVADFTGTVRVIMTGQNCQTTDQSCCRLAYKRGTLELPYLSITPTVRRVEAPPDTVVYTISSNTVWTLSDDTPWVTGILPASGEGDSTFTVFYDENTGPARTARITGTSYAATASSMLIQRAVIPPVPVNYSAADTTIAPNRIACFDAQQVLTVGGAGGPFLVQDTGSAYLISGQRIHLLYGTKVEAGGFLYARITQDNQYCEVLNGTYKPVAIGTSGIPASADSQNPLFRIYPNPTSGQFILEFTGKPGPVRATVGIFDMQGGLVSRKELEGSNQYGLSVSSFPSGLYFIHVISGQTAESVKLIKL